MAKSKVILIVGGSGYLGSHLALRFRDKFKVYCTYFKHHYTIAGTTFLPFDAGDKDWTKRVVYSIEPSVIIYAAGSNDMQEAEEDPRDADRMHAGGSVGVASVADIFKPQFIYISNNYTFDGERGNYTESDNLMPVTNLGKAKANGENFIKRNAYNHIIVRTSPLYGRGNGVHLSWLDYLRLRLEKGERIEIPETEIHSYAPVHGFLDFIERIVETKTRNQVLHYSGLTKLSQVEFARAFAKYFGYDSKLIVAKRATPAAGIEMSEYNTFFDYSLNCTSAVKQLNIKPLLLEEGFDLLKKNF